MPAPTGPSDRVRTCGLMVPNHPRYQLRHTRIHVLLSERKTPLLAIRRETRYSRRFASGIKRL